jgi:hypothetical protein
MNFQQVRKWIFITFASLIDGRKGNEEAREGGKKKLKLIKIPPLLDFFFVSFHSYFREGGKSLAEKLFLARCLRRKKEKSSSSLPSLVFFEES